MSCRAALLGALALVMLALPPAGRAATPPPAMADQIRTFANCAGRMLALRDHLENFGGREGAVRAGAAHRAHLDVLDALVESAELDATTARQVLYWRIDARVAQRQILQQALFGQGADIRRRAQAAADRHVGLCNRLILGG